MFNLTYETKVWPLGVNKCKSPVELGSGEFANYGNVLYQAIAASPIGANMPKEFPKPKEFNEWLLNAERQYQKEYRTHFSLVVCQSILTPCEGSPSVTECFLLANETKEGMAHIAAIVDFFLKAFMSKGSLETPSPSNGTNIIPVDAGKTLETTSRISGGNISPSRRPAVKAPRKSGSKHGG